MDFNGPGGGIRHTVRPATGFAREGRPAATGVAWMRKTPLSSWFGPVRNSGNGDCSAEGAGDS
ncbi:hypothetical protein GCM10023194_62480 [Planotetraspora phitsanulokensis]|uniref:Uncharacterized protein n=1 Tax=Planotetraspora phitsanulokensis TaxID=575192 RepID=A0A8J3U5J0_9ACTN|nr:hypothetical protein [Planotetraspora phitsanulokensis]GII37531.1 hypothetical protein Pph01_25340 [Planotetraspora phitsanulokensis]